MRPLLCLVLLLLGACKPVTLVVAEAGTQPCPCADGWVCCDGKNVCASNPALCPAQSGEASVAPDASVPSDAGAIHFPLRLGAEVSVDDRNDPDNDVKVLKSAFDGVVHLVVWSGLRGVMAARFSASGALLDEVPLAIAPLEMIEPLSTIVVQARPEGGFFAAWVGPYFSSQGEPVEGGRKVWATNIGRDGVFGTVSGPATSAFAVGTSRFWLGFSGRGNELSLATWTPDAIEISAATFDESGAGFSKGLIDVPMQNAKVRAVRTVVFDGFVWVAAVLGDRLVVRRIIQRGTDEKVVDAGEVVFETMMAEINDVDLVQAQSRVVVAWGKAGGAFRGVWVASMGVDDSGHPFASAVSPIIEGDLLLLPDETRLVATKRGSLLVGARGSFGDGRSAETMGMIVEIDPVSLNRMSASSFSLGPLPENSSFFSWFDASCDETGCLHFVADLLSYAYADQPRRRVFAKRAPYGVDLGGDIATFSSLRGGRLQQSWPVVLCHEPSCFVSWAAGPSTARYDRPEPRFGARYDARSAQALDATPLPVPSAAPGFLGGEAVSFEIPPCDPERGWRLRVQRLSTSSAFESVSLGDCAGARVNGVSAASPRRLASAIAFVELESSEPPKALVVTPEGIIVPRPGSLPAEYPSLVGMPQALEQHVLVELCSSASSEDCAVLLMGQSPADDRLLRSKARRFPQTLLASPNAEHVGHLSIVKPQPSDIATLQWVPMTENDNEPPVTLAQLPGAISMVADADELGFLVVVERQFFLTEPTELVAYRFSWDLTRLPPAEGTLVADHVLPSRRAPNVALTTSGANRWVIAYAHDPTWDAPGVLFQAPVARVYTRVLFDAP